MKVVEGKVQEGKTTELFLSPPPPPLMLSGHKSVDLSWRTVATPYTWVIADDVVCVNVPLTNTWADA
jgi:hypothetical protein